MTYALVDIKYLTPKYKYGHWTGRNSLEILQEARRLVDQAWTQGRGRKKRFLRADAYCLSGAVNMAMCGDPEGVDEILCPSFSARDEVYAAKHAVRTAVEATGFEKPKGSNLPYEAAFNDAQTSKEAVLAVLDDAICRLP